MTPSLRRFALVACLSAVCGCAAGNSGGPPPTSMPAARAALRPEYRLFYDALQDYGDWVLIEPYGFVFRPKVDFATFHPYQDGFWAPTDAFGWVWISAEPFGWATYHYGSWLWDRYQGWVWMPGIDWGPAWVSWQIAGGYVGWAPMGPSGGGWSGGGPGGDYLYAPLSRMGSTDLAAHVATPADLGNAVANAQPADDLVERDGVRLNLGPPIARIERAVGMTLPRAKLTEVGNRREPAREATSGPSPGGEIDAARREAEIATRRARALIEAGGRTPSVLPIVRPAAIGAPGRGIDVKKRPARPRPSDAAPDTTR
jgi:hypothetical protein